MTAGITNVMLAAAVLAGAIVGTRGVLADSGGGASLRAHVKVNALAVGLSISTTNPRHHTIAVSVRNLDVRPLRDIDVTLHAGDRTCLALRGPATHHRGRLGGTGELSVIWRADLVNRDGCGEAVIMARVTAVDSDGDVLTMESDARLLTAVR